MRKSGQALPVHPITGLTAIGFKKNGSAIWPIMGGDGTDNPPVPGQAEPLIEGGNPAWNDILKYIPEEQRQEVVPFLQQRDKDIQDKIQRVHSEYDGWGDFVKSGVDPETAQFAIEVLAKMQEDPRSIYDSLGQHFGWANGNITETPSEPGQGKESQQLGDPNFDLEKHPAFQQIKQQNEILANIMLAQHREAQQANTDAEADAALEAEFEAAEAKYGKFDQRANDFIEMYMIANDVSVDDAAQAYFKFTEGLGVGRRPAPKVMSGSGGGSVPTPKADFKKMTDKEAKDVFAQMLIDAQRG